LGARDLADERRVRLHPLAAHRRRQEPALAQVRRAVEEQHRVLADERLEQRVRLARVEHVRVAGEDLLHQRGRRREHERAEPREVRRERIAVFPRTVLEPLERPLRELDELDDGGLARTGWERHAEWDANTPKIVPLWKRVDRSSLLPARGPATTRNCQ